MGSRRGFGCYAGAHLKSNPEELQFLVIRPDWLQRCGQQFAWVQVKLLSRDSPNFAVSKSICTGGYAAW